MSRLENLASEPILESMIKGLSITDIDNMIQTNPLLENKLLNIKAYQDILYVKAQIDFFMKRLKKLVNQEVDYVKSANFDNRNYLGIRTIDKSGNITGIKDQTIYLNWSPVYDLYIVNYLDGDIKTLRYEYPKFVDLLEQLYREENEFTFHNQPIAIDTVKDVFLKAMIHPTGNYIFYYDINPEFANRLNPFLKENLGASDKLYIINDTEIGNGEILTSLKNPEDMYSLIELIISNGFVPKISFYDDFNLYDIELAFYTELLTTPQ